MTTPALRLAGPTCLVALFLAGCPAGDDDVEPADDDATIEDGCDGVEPAITDIDADELAAMLDDKDFLLINVHVPYAGEIPGTDAHIAYTDVDGLVTYLGDDLSIKAVLYCSTGPMSVNAANKLIDEGYCQIHDFPGGMSAWQQAGYSLE